MTELEAIYERHSVRQYQDRKINPEKVEKIKALIDECNREGDLHIQFIEDADGAMNRLFNRVAGLGTAPSLIACVGKKSDDLEERIGYYGQKVVLYAQTLGLNTCWVGMFSASKVHCEICEDEKLVIVIAIGYGKTSGKTRKSKDAEQVVADGTEGKPEWFKKGIETALLAPTAMNQQKFVISLSGEDSITIKDLGGPFSKVDVGIVKYNFDVGREA